MTEHKHNEQEQVTVPRDPIERINAIINHPDFQSWIIANNQAELGREFCRHGLEHALDVARIAYELWCDAGGNPVARDIVYAAALLHDIGKWAAYDDDKLDHAEVGAELAEDILNDIGYHPQITAEILKAIRNHRRPGNEGLSDVIYRADKLSRPCFVCPVADKCKWEIKNERLIY